LAFAREPPPERDAVARILPSTLESDLSMDAGSRRPWLLGAWAMSAIGAAIAFNLSTKNLGIIDLDRAIVWKRQQYAHPADTPPGGP
jgi:hypothetical protein